jgi:regulator of sigma E protease
MRVVYILQVAVGLGFVIFLHELGHFLLAKWNGVKVEKFSIGFGKTLFGFRRGETEYVLAAIPLGGFVKMLGESPDDENSKTTDPRAYPNKSVGARMAIISAGVIMNVFLGLACFVYAYGHGMDVKPARVGDVMVGSPAYRAGMLPGDEIVAIDGRRDISFSTLQLKVALSGQGQVLHFAIERPGQQGPIEMDLEPRLEPKQDKPTIGIVPSESLEILGFLPPAGMDKPPSYARPEGKEAEKTVDTLVAAGPAGQEPKKLADVVDYRRLLAGNLDQPIKHIIERRAAGAAANAPALERFEVTMPPNQFVDFGFRLTAEPILAIRHGSPADQGGFRAGDRIIKVDGRDDFDPMRLPTEAYQRAGKKMTFLVERTLAGGERKTETLTATPDDTPPWSATFQIYDTALDVPGLGFSLPIRPLIAAVRPESAAARAGLLPGQVINSMTVTPMPVPSTTPEGAKEMAAAVRPIPIAFDERGHGWAYAFGLLQNRPMKEISLVVNKASQPIKIAVETDQSWSNPERGLEFLELTRELPPQPIASALRRGFDDTIENILNIYAMFRSLFTGRVSVNNLGGVITISRVSYYTARLGTTYLIHFLGILSINLAVLNFLPIPPLDGGQMVFLLAEKVRGRPLPDSALIAGTYLGLLLVLLLMVFVTFQDIFRLIKEYL